MRVGVLEGHDYQVWERRWRRGQAPTRWPYGLELLEQGGRSVDVPTARIRRLTRSRSVNALVNATHVAFDCDPVEVLLSRRRLQRADVVLAMFEEKGPPYELLRRAHRSMPPLALMTCWLGQRLTMAGARVDRIYGPVVRNALLVTVFSTNQVALVADRLGVPRRRVQPVRFGVDTRWFSPGSGEPQPTALAVGNDVGRDWATFMTAARRLPDVRFCVVAPGPRLRGVETPANVEVRPAVDLVTYRLLLQTSAVVIVPSRTLAYPTGQSVFLQALACGRPTVVTRWPAMRDYIVDGSCLPVQPEDPDALVRAVSEVIRDPAAAAEIGARARATAVESFTAEAMWRHVGDLLDAAFGS